MLNSDSGSAATAGLLGAFAAPSGSPEELASRIQRSRRPGMTYGWTGLASKQAAPVTCSVAGRPPIATHIAGPILDSASSQGSGGAAPGVTVCFDGHLIEPVQGIDIPVTRPADIVREAYRRWGRECLGRFNGNYCVALVDPTLQALYLARDAAGSMPLYYCFTDHLVFGTSALEVLRVSGLPAKADPCALYRYLVEGAIAGTRHTLFQHILQLENGQYLSAVVGKAPKLHPVEPGIASPVPSRESLSECAHSLRALLLNTIQVQSRGKVVGIALSGGIDSSGLLAGLRHACGPDAPINAFTFAHGHPSLPAAMDERPWAKLAARSAGAKLHTVTLQAAKIPGNLARIFQSQDFPFGSPVLLAQAEVFRVAAQAGMEVMLSGHGPDVLFGGGNSHIAVRLSGLLRQARLIDAVRMARGASPYAGRSPRGLLLSAVAQLAPRPVITALRRGAPAWIRQSWFADRLAVDTDKHGSQAGDPLQLLIQAQLNRTSLPSTLQWEGRNAAAYGLDNRMSYLVPSMLQMAATLPSEYLVSPGGETKHILRLALRGMVPDPILERRERVGFAVPALPWLHELGTWVKERRRSFELLPFYDGPSRQDAERAQKDSFVSEADAFLSWRWIILQEWITQNNVAFD